jgi:hypothetical protein
MDAQKYNCLISKDLKLNCTEKNHQLGRLEIESLSMCKSIFTLSNFFRTKSPVPCQMKMDDQSERVRSITLCFHHTEETNRL